MPVVSSVCNGNCLTVSLGYLTLCFAKIDDSNTHSQWSPLRGFMKMLAKDFNIMTSLQA